LADEEPDEVGERANSVSELATVSVSYFRAPLVIAVLVKTLSLQTPPAEE